VTRSSALAERVYRTLETRLGWDRNYTLGVLNGWLVFAGDGFMNAGVVLSSFAAALGASNAVIGLLPAVQNGGWLAPQLAVASRIRHLPRKIVAYRAAATARTLSYAWMAASSAVFAGNPTVLLASFILGMVANALAAGVAGLPWMEIVAKVVPARERPGFFAARNVVGGLLGLLAGLVVRQILGSSIPFPYNYTLIFGLGLAFYTVGYGVFGLIAEPPDPPQERAHFRDELRGLPATVRGDRDFSAFVALRLVLAFTAIADPFFTVYALRVVGVRPEMIGAFLVVIGIVGPLSNAIWARLATRFGSRRIIRLSLAFAALAPLAALLMPRGAGLAYALVYVLGGIGGAGLNLGNTSHLLAIAPPEARGRYIGVLNTLVGLASFAPVLGGGLADSLGYAPVFGAGVGLYVLAWLLAGRLRRDA
jgi:MFS family permease